MSTPTLETTSFVPAPATAQVLRRYRLAVLLLMVALAAMVAATVYLATRPTLTTGQARTPVSPGASQVVPCFRQAVPC